MAFESWMIIDRHWNNGLLNNGQLKHALLNSRILNDELLTRQEVAEYLRISLVTIHSWNKHGILNPIRMGNRILYKKQDILDVLEEQSINKKR